MQRIRDPRAGKPGGRQPSDRTVRLEGDEPSELERHLAEYTEIIDERLEEGLATLQRSAGKLMRHLAAEVWRASGPDAGKNLKEGVLAALAQDDAIRGLLSHTDERFQSLQIRVARMEGAIRQLAEATRDAVKHVSERAREMEGSGATEEIARQREDLARFSQRMGVGLNEMHRRIQAGVRAELERVREEVGGELQRLEAAVSSESAFAAEAARELREELRSIVDGTAERTGVVLEGIHADLARRLTESMETLEERARDAESLVGRTEALRRDLVERLERLEAGLERQRERMNDYAGQAAEGLAEVARRMQGEIATIAERAEEAERRAGGRLEAVDAAIQESGRRGAEFADRVGQGLTEVTGRIRDGFQLILDRSAEETRRSVGQAEEALREEVASLQAQVEDVATRTGTVLEGIQADLARRIDSTAGSMREEAIHLVTQLVGRHAGQQGRSLQAITESLRALLDAVRRSGEDQSASMERVLRASAGRQEAVLDESLTALRASVEELTSLYASDPRPEDAAVFTRRLRGVERRLQRLSQELAGDVA
ncbi:MAG TPA: hypothetical protein VMP42_07365 [Actinomycetota bacterium]|nr:hypothetical protein [Actinomycetota bacterium]